MIRPEDRNLETVRIAVTVGELLDGDVPPMRARQTEPEIGEVGVGAGLRFAPALTSLALRSPPLSGGRVASLLLISYLCDAAKK